MSVCMYIYMYMYVYISVCMYICIQFIDIEYDLVRETKWCLLECFFFGKLKVVLVLFSFSHIIRQLPIC